MGQGYVRQSAADIVNGNRIQAEHFNNEYNALQAAFDGNSGHSHDGTIGEGQKILLTSSVTGTLPITNGGTGATDVAGIKTNMGLGTMAEQNANSVAITGGTITATLTGNTTGTHTGPVVSSNATITGGSITGITDLAVSDGGTGASTASAARTNLGLGTISTQAANSVSITGGSITGITDLAIADGGTGASDATTARSNLGLGSIATQAASSVNITGGTITGITDLAVADGGTGASTASAARTNLGLVIGTDVQAYDAELAALAGLTSAADKVPYFTGSGTASTFTATTYGRSLIDDADSATARQTLGMNMRIFSGTFSGAGPVNIVDLGVQGTPLLLECDIRALPTSTSAAILLRFSSNNGSSWHNGGSDYGNNFMWTSQGISTAQGTDTQVGSSAYVFDWGGTSIVHAGLSGFGARAKFSITTSTGYSVAIGDQAYHAIVDSRLYQGMTLTWIGAGPINALQLSSAQNFQGQYVIKVYY